MSLTENMTTEEVIALAETRPEFPWHWGERLDYYEAERFAREHGFGLQWDVPIRPGDLYLANRNTGWHLLKCRELGEACVFSVEIAYAYDFNECVKVVP